MSPEPVRQSQPEVGNVALSLDLTDGDVFTGLEISGFLINAAVIGRELMCFQRCSRLRSCFHLTAFHGLTLYFSTMYMAPAGN